MKNLLITLISTLLLLATGLSYAEDSGPEPRRTHHHKQHGNQIPVADQLFRSFRRLDLDEAQQTELKGIFQAMKAELKPLMSEMRAGQKQLRDQLQSGNFDETAIQAIAQKEGELATERLMITSKAIANAFGLLNDEQRAQLEINAAERRARRGERLNKRRAENRVVSGTG